MTLYTPSGSELLAVAGRAPLANPNPQAREWIVNKVSNPPADWESRVQCTVPGIVWTVPSDTCMTGRPNAPRNIAYDHYGAEFVYRQPTVEDELAGVMSADTEEVFACYRFDGLTRWTVAAFGAWCHSTHDIVVGWIRAQLTEADGEIAEGLCDALDYLTGDEFRTYLVEFGRLLRSDAK